jgi:DNA-binding transcriptional ArsR family regulator
MKQNPAEIFKVLGVNTRIRILELLKTEGPVGANYIADQLGITPAAASQHLKILKHAGLVRSERKGFRIPYSIDEEAMGNCHDALSEVCRCHCHATVKYGKHGMTPSNLDSLKKYKKELEEELRMIEQKIRDIENAK